MTDETAQAVEWQVGVWDRISDIYAREIDQRFAPVVESLIEQARLAEGERVLDLGTGTGAVAEQAAKELGESGSVVGVDISAEMLSLAQRRIAGSNLGNVSLREGRGEEIPAEPSSFDVVLSCLALMYVIDREAAAREIARVLRPGGRFVGAVWAGPDECEIVRFQECAGRFAGPPPVPGVGPGAMADPAPFLKQLADAGLDAQVESKTLGFDFPDFQSAWMALAGVTTAHLPEEEQEAAKQGVRAEMYPGGDGPRHFENSTHFLIGHKR